MNVNSLLFYLGSIHELFLLLFIENLLVSLSAILMGVFLSRTYGKPFNIPTQRERKYFSITLFLNTAITYFGYLLWDENIIRISLKIDLTIIPHLLFLFMVMDFITYCLHYLMHTRFLFQKIHYLQHLTKELNPANIFVIHPVETLLFGLSFVVVLNLFTFNIYAIILFLVINITWVVIANLGINKSLSTRKISSLLIGPAFRLQHHQSGNVNFGFYTKIWDYVFKTAASAYAVLIKNQV